MPKPTPGALVGGKYQILRSVGEGGMGTVYEAEHVLTHKRAAIKWVHPQSGPSHSAHERLLHEARATSRIHHRNVVDVYDVLRDDDAVCLVMQLLVGEPLSDRILRGSMFIGEFIALLLPAMRGIAAAHAVGVIHRDIKPDNIFLAQESGQLEVVPKVIDFGISKIFEPRSSRAPTHSGITMGTPRYVSYEQLLGARDVDARTDVYAFGVMLYEALTGESPYRASTFGEQAVAFAMSVPARASALRPQIPSALDDLVFRAIAKEREARIPSMQAFIAELEPFTHAEAFDEPLLAFSECARASGAPHLHAVTAPAGQEPSMGALAPAGEVSRPSIASSPNARAYLPRRLGWLAAALLVLSAVSLGWAHTTHRAAPARNAAAAGTQKVVGSSAAPEHEQWVRGEARASEVSYTGLVPVRDNGRAVIDPTLHAVPEAPALSLRSAAPKRRVQPRAEKRTEAAVTSTASVESGFEPRPELRGNGSTLAAHAEQASERSEALPQVDYRAGGLTRDEF